MSDPSLTLPDRLLEHSRWLRSLARSLVHDEASAEDLVQETWLAALRNPPREETRVRAWLGRVARRIAWTGSDRELARVHRERQAARDDRVPSTEQMIEEVGLRRTLASAVVELAEPYRTTILLRYFEELGPQEIARRTETPIETVKSRIKRGLASLRGRLDTDFGGNESWRRSLAPLAGWGMAAVGTGAGPGAVVAGSLALKTKILAVLVIAGLSAIGWLVIDRSRRIEEPSGRLAPPGQRSSSEQGEVEALAVSRNDAPPTATETTSQSSVKTNGVDGADLRIQVVDADGVPLAGIPLAIDRVREGKPSHLWEGSTKGASGMAVVPRFAQDFSWNPEAEEVYAMASVHLVRPPIVTLQPGVVPADPLQLVLPPTGRVVVELADRWGKPLAQNGAARIRVAGGLEREGGRGPLQPGYLSGIGASSWRLFEHGQVVFPFVELGLRLELNLHVSMGERVSMTPLSETFDGPVTKAQTVTYVWRIQSPTFTWRILDKQLEPIPNREVYLWYRSWTPVSSYCTRLTSRTDGDGHLRFALHPPREGYPVRRAITFALERASIWSLDPPQLGPSGLGARSQIPTDSKDGDTHLGDLVLQTSPEILSGHVVDESGIGIEGVRLHEVQLLGEVDPAEDWQAEHDLGAVTDRQGRFVLRSHARAESVMVKASKPGFSPSDFGPYAAGARGMRLVLSAHGQLVGWLRVDMGIDPFEFAITLGDEQGNLQTVRAEEDGSFAFDSLTRGRHVLEVLLGDDVFARVDALEIQGRRTTRDPRLDPIDLRGRVNLLALRVHDEHGARLNEESIMIRDPADPQRVQSNRSDSEGHVIFLLPEAWDSVVVTSPGREARRLTWSDAPQDITLRKGWPVTIRLTDTELVPQGPRALELVLLSESGNTLVPPSGIAKLVDSSGKLELTVPAPGRYRVAWTVVEFEGPRSRRRALEIREPRSLDVSDQSTRQSFALEIPAEPLRAALKKY